MKLMNAVDVDQRSPVNPNKPARSQFIVQLSNSLIDHVILSRRCGVSQFVASKEMRDARQLNELHPFPNPRSNSIGIFRRLGHQPLQQFTQIRTRLPTSTHTLDLVQGAVELRSLNRLQKIVHGVDAERLKRILIVRGGEDDHGLKLEVRQHLQTVY